MEKYSVKAHQIISEFGLEVLYGAEGYLEKDISSTEVNRPALPLAGFYECFDNDVIQVLGNVEILIWAVFRLSRERRALSGC